MHFIVEYSPNLALTAQQWQDLFEQLHSLAVATQLFPLKGIRSRAHCCEHYRVANGDSHFAFVHLEVRIGTGRTLADRQSAASKIFALLKQYFEPWTQKGLALSMNFDQLQDQGLRFNSNNIQQFLGDD